MTAALRPLGEFELIERFFANAGTAGEQRSDVILGIGDDAAVLRMPANMDLVAAVDTLVAGKHFPSDSDAEAIGHRVLAVNLSDIAAMGATPAWATLALTLPRADAAWLARFSSGLRRLAAEHRVALVGGDTTAGPLTISLQILGTVERGTALLRSGGRAGDLLAVTGTLGDAGAGLALVTGVIGTTDLAAADLTAAQQLIARFEYPTPRVAFGRRARGIASAAMDLSDGLVGDLPKLAHASGLAAHVEVTRLPLSSPLLALVAPRRAREYALAAGDDYELLIAVSPLHWDDLADAARECGLNLTVIGELMEGTGVTWAEEGRAFVPELRGYDHFRPVPAAWRT